MKKSISKSDAEKQIKEFFENIEDKTDKDVKKIKRLAMSHNIHLKDKRKLFCKKCLTPHNDSSVRIKNDMITITCGKCDNKNRWKL